MVYPKERTAGPLDPNWLESPEVRARLANQATLVTDLLLADETLLPAADRLVGAALYFLTTCWLLGVAPGDVIAQIAPLHAEGHFNPPVTH